MVAKVMNESLNVSRRYHFFKMSANIKCILLVFSILIAVIAIPIANFLSFKNASRNILKVEKLYRKDGLSFVKTISNEDIKNNTDINDQNSIVIHLEYIGNW